MARLVGTYGSTPMDLWAIELLINASIEPDRINKQKITDDISNAFSVPIERLFDHTIRAKELTVYFIHEAFNTRHKGINSWLKILGWAFHYIADWGTPHHSPISKSNPIPTWTVGGAISGAIINSIIKPGKNLGDALKKIVEGALWGGGLGFGAGAIDLVIKHSDFESLCDERWKTHSTLVKNHFEVKKGCRQLPNQLEPALKLLEEMMDNLRQKCNNLPVKWIKTCSKSEFADYMAQIGIIMDFACQIVVK